MILTGTAAVTGEYRFAVRSRLNEFRPVAVQGFGYSLIRVLQPGAK